MATVKYRNVVNVNWDTVKAVSGPVVSIGAFDVEGRKVRFLLVDDERARFRVYESKALEEAFNAAAVGDRISIEYLHTLVLDGGRTMRQFNVQLYDKDQPALPLAAPKSAGG